MRQATLTTIVLAATLSGCGGRTFYGTWEDGGATPDGTTRPDGAITDAAVRPDGGGTCTDQAQWEPMPVPLDSVTVLNPQYGGSGIPEGVSVRVAVELTYTGCDEMAGVQALVWPDDRSILLMGYVWRYLGQRDCPYLASTGREVLSLPELRPGDWTLTDYMVNGPFIPFTVRPCSGGEDCQCQAWQGIPGDWGAECNFDCMCAAPLGCNYEGMGNMGPQCFQTCSVTSDCPPALFCNEGFLPQSPENICLATGLIDPCDTDADCPAGHACRPDPVVGVDLCVAAMPTQPMGRPCDGDCDCPAGYSCIADPTAENPTCQIRCRGNRDCPRGTQCDQPAAPAGAGSNALTCGFVPSP